LAFLEIATELGQLAKVSHVLLHKVPFIGIRYISTFWTNAWGGAWKRRRQVHVVNLFTEMLSAEYRVCSTTHILCTSLFLNKTKS